MNPINPLTLKISNLEKSYGRRKVLRDINLELSSREVIALLGPNGAGKTTLFYTIAGIVKADSGHIMLNDRDILTLPMHVRARMGISYLPQETSIFRHMTVEENILSVLEIVETNKKTRMQKLEALLDEFSIRKLRSNHALSLSGGERRRVEIARTLACNPSFVLLDEPFAGLDPIVVNDIIDIIKYLQTKNIGVLITDHNARETLRVVNRAYIIYDGRILISGRPDDIIEHDAVKKIYLGEGF